MECRCPSCDVILLWNEAITEESWITCHSCDRGFRPRDARCADCGTTFGRTAWFGHRCEAEERPAVRLAPAFAQ